MTTFCTVYDRLTTIRSFASIEDARANAEREAASTGFTVLEVREATAEDLDWGE